MCAQAGCGSCVVTATHVNPASGEETTHSVNSVKKPNIVKFTALFLFLNHDTVHHSGVQVQRLENHDSRRTRKHKERPG